MQLRRNRYFCPQHFAAEAKINCCVLLVAEGEEKVGAHAFGEKIVLKPRVRPHARNSRCAAISSSFAPLHASRYVPFRPTVEPFRTHRMAFRMVVSLVHPHLNTVRICTYLHDQMRVQTLSQTCR